MSKLIAVSDLIGPALDWAVAKCLGVTWWAADSPKDGLFLDYDRTIRYQPSTDWAQGGPIIERNRINLYRNGGEWSADIMYHDDSGGGDVEEGGTTPLIAAMRCYVASKLGDTVDIPEGLK